MSDMATTYHDLIKEAFIDPIRTVTVIDDEYPTLKEFLKNSHNNEENTSLNNKLSNAANINRLNEIITFCHENKKWNIDVFDGSHPDMVPDHINHSDLIFLDYHLNGIVENDDGSKARAVVNNLSNNNHFNIVVIHTNGDDSSNPLEEIFFTILNDFKKIEDFLEVSEEDDAALEDFFDSNEYAFIDNTYSLKDIYNVINDGISIDDKKHILNCYINDISTISSKTNTSTKTVINKVFKNSFNNTEKKFTNKNENLFYKWGESEDINFISTGRIFITVVKKENEKFEESVFEKLKNALFALRTPPMQLLMARIRFELDERGIIEAAEISRNEIAQIGWLKDMFYSEDNDFKHQSAINRYWEQLSDATKDTLIEFSKKTYKVLRDTHKESSELINYFFPASNHVEVELLKHLNSFICSTNLKGNHLNTGTILELTKGDEKEYWVCVTPACDLVPSQSKKRWQERLGDKHSAFQAVKLIEQNITGKNSIKNLKKHINNNEIIFIEINSEIKVFRFTKDENSNPIWETFYALNHGSFDEDNHLHFQHVTIGKIIDSDNSELKISFSAEKKMKAISSLRYEYALNLLQKFGSNQSRVGLDFISQLT
jgi:hypothetical protein